VVPTFVDIAVPAITFLLLLTAGSDLTPADFDQVRRRPALVVAGVLAPVAILPLIALSLIALVRPSPSIESGVLLIAACPIGGISNTYSYLARASTALSVTLTGLSCVLAAATMPMLGVVFAMASDRALELSAPVELLIAQMLLMLALPVGLGMWIRHRWPELTRNLRASLQRAGFTALGILLLVVVLDDAARFARELPRTVPLAALFVFFCFAVGWLVGRVLDADRADRFTLAAEFATRNVAVATAISVTVLGRPEFATFAATYFLTEVPLLLIAVGAFRLTSVRGVRLEPDASLAPTRKADPSAARRN
jgi:BASS family bile acid:Na+ symporter